MNVFEVTEGQSPIILGQPHGGTHVPDEIFSRLNPCGKGLDDTDWHITQLYDGLLPEVTVVRSNVHRYVIDANRDPSGVSLYPGQNTTSLCPVTNFEGEPIWEDGQEPSEDEILARRDGYHAPYHQALQQQLERVRKKHGIAILYDCHSIRSEISFLFDGILPVFSIGTNNGVTCDTRISDAVISVNADAMGYDQVLNGRFKGGWTTRHYGQPFEGFHAIQMELAQRSYMDEAAPWTYQPERADKLRVHLKTILTQLEDFALSGAVIN